MAYGFVPIIHIVAAVLSIVELGLTAYSVSVYQSAANGGWTYGSRSPDQVNFMLFNSIWSLLVLAYVGLTPLYATHLFHKLASLALEAVTVIFWFAGSIALAVAVGGPWNCGNNHLCGALEAAVAFGFVLWALFTVLLVIDAIEAMRSRRNHTTTTGTTGVDGHHHHHGTKPYAGA